MQLGDIDRRWQRRARGALLAWGVACGVSTGCSSDAASSGNHPQVGSGGTTAGTGATAGTAGTGASTSSTGGSGPAPYVAPACIDGTSHSTPRSKPLHCTPPRAVKTFYGGNGHTETWDGRVFIVTRGPAPVGWRVRVFRPERLVVDENGVPDFSQNQPFSEEAELELDQVEGQHNAHATIPHPDYPENPYRSNQDGSKNPSGEYLTYEILLFAQNYQDNSSLQRRHARIVVKSPSTVDAAVESASMVDDYQTIFTKSGDKLRAIEPTLTLDGHLIIAQGHPDNDGKIDTLVYSYNEDPLATEGWTEPRYITALHAERDVVIDGIALGDRIPLAKSALLDQSGVAYAADEEFRGAYPWISQDGTELFFMALRTFDGARRGGASVVGRWTNWGVRHIDGPINPNRVGTQETLRLFFSSPGAFTTMWTPYTTMTEPVFPYTASGPSFPLFGSNSDNYVEVSFRDTTDGNYLLALRMNELVSHASEADPEKTPDTSGHHHVGHLEGGAKFPLEYDAVDEIVGKVGQAVYFPLGGQVRVAHDAALDSSALTVEAYVQRLVDLGQDAQDRPVSLVEKAGVFRLGLDGSGTPTATVVVGGSERALSFGTALPLDQWVHLSLTYDPPTGELIGFVDGVPAGSTPGTPGDLATTTTDVIVGPGAQAAEAAPFLTDGQAVLLIDEVLISDIIRSEDELRAAAYNCLPEPPTQTLPDLPLGLRAHEVRIPAEAVMTSAAVELGKMLFFDGRLSKDGDMACSTCHSPDKGFGDGLPTALGRDAFLPRNTPMIWNRALSSTQFWDGASRSLEEQALVPIENPEEMALPLDEALTRLNGIPGYVDAFQSAFGAPPSADALASALAAFQRSLLSGDSAVDRFEAGELTALTESERRGRLLFHTKARCAGCHSGSNYTDERFRNNGLTCVGDPGRQAVTGLARDAGLFKTPSLRNVSRTAPYLHDGSLATLEEVIAAYDRGGNHAYNVDTEIRPLGLSAEEKADLLAFLLALDGSEPVLEQPALP